MKTYEVEYKDMTDTSAANQMRDDLFDESVAMLLRRNKECGLVPEDGKKVKSLTFNEDRIIINIEK